MWMYLINGSRRVVQESAQPDETVVVADFDISEATLTNWLLLLVSRPIDREVHLIGRALRAEHVAAQLAVVLC